MTGCIREDECQMIYVVSGPPGVGKSTVSAALAESLPRSALIRGDDVHHMIVGGHRAPWEDEEQSKLTCYNIASLTSNFTASGFDVIIDYVAFPEDVQWLRAQTSHEVQYTVLMAEQKTLMERDAVRADSMGERCLAVLEEFLTLDPQPEQVLFTDSMSVEEVVRQIKVTHVRSE